jgi:molecular chaperone GrpE
LAEEQEQAGQTQADEIETDETQARETGQVIEEPRVEADKEELIEVPAGEWAALHQELAEFKQELAEFKQELEEVQAREAEYLDGWQRARAELSNARKRFQRDQEQTYDNAKANVLTRLLPVVDDFERARETLPENLVGIPWIEGILLIQRKLQALLDQDGVTVIEAKGQEFDPYFHQAITHEPSDTVPEGHVIDTMQKGYRMADRVLRPSMVRVSSGPPPAEVEVQLEGEPQTEAASKE